MGEPGENEIDYNNPPFPLTAIDRELLAMKDEDFHRITWDDVKQIIANNTLEDLKRLPSDLRRYLASCDDIKQRYGSITMFVIKERLRWNPTPTPVPPSSTSCCCCCSSSSSSSSAASAPPAFEHRSEVPFEDRRDYAVLLNDWPYAFSPGITHMLVWSKTPIAVDALRGDVTPESRRRIDDFVDRFFVRALSRERVVWFKNWVDLQSVRGVDHVHVLVRDAPAEGLEEWTQRHDLQPTSSGGRDM